MLIINVKKYYCLPFLTNLKYNYEEILVIFLEDLLIVFKILKQHIRYQYKILSCISGVDLLDCEYRFLVCYDLLSLTFNTRLRVKIYLNETNSINSLISIYCNSNWWEREIWDLFGIYFTNHSDLRRILTDYGFDGYPMRKDFPLTGFVEVAYDNIKKRVVLKPLQLSQEFRVFSFDNFW